MATFEPLFMDDKSMNSAFSDTPLARWRIFPNALDFIFLAVWVFLSQLMVIKAAMAFGLEFPDIAAAGDADADSSIAAELDMARSLMIVYTPSMLLSIVGAVVYRRLRGGRGRIVRLSAAGFNPTLLLWGVVWIVATEVVIEPLLSLLPPIPDTVGRGFFALAVTVVIAPVCEEVLCRGIILESMRAKYGVVAAWIFSSIFFAVIHGHPTSMVNALIIGSILGYICIRSKSVFSSILLHAVNNAMALTAISFGLADSTFSSLIPDRRIYYAVYMASAAVCMVGFIYLVTGFVAERRAEKTADAEKSEEQA